MGVQPIAHTAVSPHRRGWCVGVQQFAHTPLCTHTQELVCGYLASCPHVLLFSHTQAASCHVFLHCTWQLPLVCFYKQVATLFFYPSLPCVLQGTRQLPNVHVSRWQLSFTKLPYVFAWYMATAVHETWQLQFIKHGNCS